MNILNKLTILLPLWVVVMCFSSQAVNINAGPIWSKSDAHGKCPKICATQPGLIWNGHWLTVAKNMSVCNCVKPGDENLPPDYSTPPINPNPTPVTPVTPVPKPEPIPEPLPTPKPEPVVVPEPVKPEPVIVPEPVKPQPVIVPEPVKPQPVIVPEPVMPQPVIIIKPMPELAKPVIPPKTSPTMPAQPVVDDAKNNVCHMTCHHRLGVEYTGEKIFDNRTKRDSCRCFKDPDRLRGRGKI